MFDRFESIPAGLDRMPPGPALAGFLASIDVHTLSGHDRVIVLRARQRMASHFAAQAYEAMASIADTYAEEGIVEDDLVWDAAATEIRAALRLTRRAAETELGLALDLRTRLPAVWEALRSGDIDPRRAFVMIRCTAALDEATARHVVAEALPGASRMTTGELGAHLRRLAVSVDPEAASRRFTKATEQRRVVVEPSPDGTANLLGLDLPPDQVMAAARRIDRMARRLAGDDDRTLDQKRADVLLDLINGTARSDGAGGGVEITVDLATLARLGDDPGELAGYGPVVADIARQVAEAQAGGEWSFTITDPVTGLPVHDGTTRRRPTAAQRRSVVARDRCCVFPGCRMPASQCDLDHRTPWSRRRVTDTADLDAACRYDHVTVRHRLGWLRRSLPGGDHLWVSPLGHRYTKSGRPP